MTIENDITESRYLDEINELQNLVISLRDGLQLIYAERGEDKFIADIASPLIDKASLGL